MVVLLNCMYKNHLLAPFPGDAFIVLDSTLSFSAKEICRNASIPLLNSNPCPLTPAMSMIGRPSVRVCALAGAPVRVRTRVCLVVLGCAWLCLVVCMCCTRPTHTHQLDSHAYAHACAHRTRANNHTLTHGPHGQGADERVGVIRVFDECVDRQQRLSECV